MAIRPPSSWGRVCSTGSRWPPRRLYPFVVLLTHEQTGEDTEHHRRHPVADRILDRLEAIDQRLEPLLPLGNKQPKSLHVQEPRSSHCVSSWKKNVLDHARLVRRPGPGPKGGCAREPRPKLPGPAGVWHGTGPGHRFATRLARVPPILTEWDLRVIPATRRFSPEISWISRTRQPAGQMISKEGTRRIGPCNRNRSRPRDPQPCH
jgi:hypothetical protein